MPGGSATGIGTSSNGNVGIGTASPNEKLHVVGDIYADLGEGFRLFGDYHYFGAYQDAIVFEMRDGNAIGGATDGGFVFRGYTPTDSIAKNWMVIKSPGNVGVGTLAPASIAHFSRSSGDAVLSIENSGNGNSSGIDFIRERQSGAGIGGAAIFLDSDTATNNAFLYIQAQSASAPSGITAALAANNGARIILRGGTGEISFESGATESVRINAAGNLGIGAGPDAKLSIYPGLASATTYGGRSINFGANLHSISGRSGFTVKVANNYTAADDNAGFQWLFPFDDGGNAGYKPIRVSVGSSLTDRFYVRQDGGGYFADNLGIGTTSPTHKLAVNGTVRAKEVIVDTGWADHVFKKGYRLAPLTEVEAHIEREGHLPGIPSAADVAEHGVSMGEMQAKLLAKVEELTLHLIRIEKENTELRQRVQTLESSR